MRFRSGGIVLFFGWVFCIGLAPVFAQNPAQTFCERLGFKYDEIDIGWGEQEICVFSTRSGDFCDAWAFYEGWCGENNYDDSLKSKVEAEYNKELSRIELPPSSSGAKEPSAGEDKISSGSSFPSSFDWRNYVFLTLPRQQGRCGSCWAHATIGAIEAKYRILNRGLPIDLSEQDLLSCSGAGTCSGGWPSSALSYIQSEGIASESCFPYADKLASTGTPAIPCESKDPSCKEELCKISGYGNVGRDKDEIKRYLLPTNMGGLGKGPLIVSLGMGSLKPPYSSGDIWTCDYSQPIGHAVLLVGYSDTGDPKTSYWILKNSYGLTWPKGTGDGYFNVEMDCFEGTDIWYVDSVFLEKGASSTDLYCDASSAGADRNYISQFSLGSGTRQFRFPSPYSRLTEGIFAYLERGENYRVNLMVSSLDNSMEYAAIWVDFDQDGVFSDSEKLDVGQKSCSGLCEISGTLSVPSSALDGNTRLRVRLGRNPPLRPCGLADFGVVQDYTVQISEKTSPCGPLDGSMTLDRDVSSGGTCFRIQADNIVLDCNGHKIRYSQTEQGYAIDNPSYSNLVVKNCIIEQGSSTSDSPAIHISGGNNNIFENNLIETTGERSYGIYLKSSSGNMVNSNTVAVHGATNTHPIYLDSSPRNSVTENTLSSKGKFTNYGIYLYSSPENRIEGNNIAMNDAGQNYDSESPQQFNYAIKAFMSDGLSIKNNDLQSSGFVSKGIDLLKSGGSEIYGNEISIEGYFARGLEVQEGLDIGIRENNIYLSGSRSWGLLIKENVKALIEGNTFVLEGNDLYGISCFWKDEEIHENRISLEGNYSAGILIGNSGNKVANNSITGQGFGLTGISSGSSDNSEAINSKISGNRINLGGQNIFGIVALSDSEVSENTIDLSGSERCMGIFLQGTKDTRYYARGAILNKNTLNIRSDYSKGISVSSEKTLLSKNQITASGNYNSGFNAKGLSNQITNSESWSQINENIIQENTVDIVGNYSVAIQAAHPAGFFEFNPGGQPNYDSTGFGNEAGSAKIMPGGGTIAPLFTRFTENKIDISGEGNRAVFYGGTSYEHLEGNEISLSGKHNSGVHAQNSRELKLVANQIISFDGERSSGVFLHYVNSSSIEGNTLKTEGRTSAGLYMDSCENISAKGNTISTLKGPALLIVPSKKISHYDHTIDETNTEQDKPIYYYFNQPDLEIKGKEDVGQLYLAFCDNAKIENLEMGKDGITLANMNGTTLKNIKIESEICGMAPFALIYAKDINVTDSEIKSSCENTAEIWLYNSTGVNITNATYEGSYIDAVESSLYRYWYLDLNVTDGEGKPIESAEVLCTNSKDEEEFIETTNEEGKLRRKLLLQYNQTGAAGFNAGITYVTPYKFEVTKSGYEEKTEETDLKESEEIKIVLDEESSGD
ncbi:MAG: C1 family peptidase [Candidatus Aenigmatarchaeota archaeon]